jgi:hypothetical protein
MRRPYNFNKVWLEIKESIDLKDFRFHDLHHKAVSRFVEAGLSNQEVAAISGHRSMQMLKRYTHLRAEDFGCQAGQGLSMTRLACAEIVLPNDRDSSSPCLRLGVIGALVH